MKLREFLQNHGYDPKIRIDTIEDETGNLDCFLIEGDRNTMKFLSNLFEKLSEDESEQSIYLSPTGAGSAYFSNKSKLGIYLSLTK